MSDRKTLYLLDATAMIYRAYFAFVRNPMRNSRGENTSAPFGFTSAVMKIIRDESPDYIAAVFDSAKPTFRHEQFAAYKATRERMPEELVEQLGRVDEVVEALNLPNIRVDRYEADDLIGTLAVKGEAAGLDVILVTSDKDLMQLVTDHVSMLSPAKTKSGWDRIGRDEVVEKWDVGPDKIVDLLGLMGDTSDNIPGVPKVGPKTAAKLIHQYETLEGVLEHASEVKQPVLRNNLTEFADQARFSRKLATIETNSPVELDFDKFAWTGPDMEKARALFIELEFLGFLEQLVPDEIAERHEADYVRVTPENLTEVCDRMQASGRFAIDTETSSTEAATADLVGISLACDDAVGYYIPIGHRRPGLMEEPAEENVPLELIHEHLDPVLADEKTEKVAQNWKFDLVVLEKAGFTVGGPLFDTMIASYVLDPGSRHSLDAMAEIHLHHRMVPISDLIGKGKEQISFTFAPVEASVAYSGEDALVTWRLSELFHEKLDETQLRSLHDDLELPVMRTLLRMEQVGVRIDTEILGALSADLTKRMETVEQEIYLQVDMAFNINSTQQLGHVLFDVIGLPSKRKTKTGFSTDQAVLEELALIHPLPKQVLEYRHLAKMLSTYIDALPRLVRPSTRRVHTSYNQTVASTGRLSSTEPNLQNIPVRTDIGGEIRKAFIPREGWEFVSADYSQIELRVMAHLSGDKTLQQAFRDDEDIHTTTASLVFGMMPGLIDAEMRRQAKAINFGVIYGQTAFGLAGSLGIPQKQAADFINNYFATYPGVKAYNEQTIEKAREDGYVTTMLGRRRYTPNINERNASRRRSVERMAINTPIQGTAADMIKVAMIAIDRRLREEDFDGHMLMQVHDELVFEVPPDQIERTVEMVRTEMAAALNLDVPVKVDIGVGENWFEAH